MRPAALALALALAAGTVAAPAEAAFDVATVTSPGGIEAWFYEDHTIPMLTIAAGFVGGAALDPEGEEGRTAVMAALLDEGAGDRDSAAFATAIEDLGAHVAFSGDRDTVTLAATMLGSTRDATVELLREALTAPRFDPEPVERVRAQALASARSNDADPQFRAMTALSAQAFPDHPYGRPTDGTTASLAALTVADLRASHAAALTRDRLRVAVVGDIAPEDLGPLLDRLFGALPAAGPALPAVATPRLGGGTTVIDVDTPQSLVLFADAGVPLGDPDMIPALVMDTILGGGGLETRLNDALRVKRGLTYGAYTWLASGTFGALYEGSFSSSNERVGEALAVLRAEWARMADEGVTEAELASAKRYLTGAFPLRFDGDEAIASQLLGLQLAGYGPDYIDHRNALVEAVTQADVARVARRVLRPETLTTVIAGRPAGVAATP